MYNNIFQEYINKMIGGTPRIESIFVNNDFHNQNNMELDRLYPDLYKLLYPMIKTACLRNTKPITAEKIEEMVKEIYSNFHNEETSQTSIKVKNKGTEINKVEKANNDFLKDVIKILLIKEVFEDQENIQPLIRQKFFI